jgi:imidazole glycerol-phosphate synthase subunit HisH
LITVVDYGRGNLFSLGQALQALDAAFVVTSDAEKVRAAEKIVLPGVGAFGDAMKALREQYLVEAIREAAARGVPLLGICLGMQLLASRSEEFGDHEGLNLIPARVRRLPRSAAVGRMRIPNVGWRSITPRTGDPFVGGVRSGEMFYFVHSYTPVPNEPDHVAATSAFNEVEIAAVIRRDQVVGTQFHPEKSAVAGLALLKRFIDHF